MPKKSCFVCGQDGHMFYPYCLKHLQEKNQGKIKKCDNCDKWYSVEKKCECSAPQKQEKKCTKCGKPCNEKFDLCYACYSNKLSATSKQTTDTVDNYTRKAIIKEIGEPSADIRKQWDAMHRTNDGHYVRSYSEMLIDNWLYQENHVHAYERKVFLKKNPNENLISDFYLPNGKVYIEFFGLDNEKYNARKEEKIALYNNNGLNLIVLEQDDIKILDDILPPLLHKYQD